MFEDFFREIKTFSRIARLFNYIFSGMEVFYKVMRQGRIGHSGNASLIAVAYSISHTQCQKRGFLEEFWGSFVFFLYGMSQGPFDPSLPLT
jgi:hypothetical protein